MAGTVPATYPLVTRWFPALAAGTALATGPGELSEPGIRVAARGAAEPSWLHEDDLRRARASLLALPPRWYELEILDAPVVEGLERRWLLWQQVRGRHIGHFLLGRAANGTVRLLLVVESEGEGEFHIEPLRDFPDSAAAVAAVVRFVRGVVHASGEPAGE